MLERGIDALPDDRSSLRLETLEGNDVATAFYRTRGFEHVGSASYEISGETYPTEVWERPLGE